MNRCNNCGGIKIKIGRQERCLDCAYVERVE